MTVTALEALLVLSAAVNLVVFVWLLRGDRRDRCGGTLDLTPAAARGQFDLDWNDPRVRS